MLNCPVSYYVDDLVDKPAVEESACRSLPGMVERTLRRIAHNPSERLLDAATQS